MAAPFVAYDKKEISISIHESDESERGVSSEESITRHFCSIVRISFFHCHLIAHRKNYFSLSPFVCSSAKLAAKLFRL